MSTGWVYRAYDASGRLIYVGSTADIFGRLDTHRQQSWWASQVARVRATVHPSLEAARSVERAAIRSENPRWNVMGRWGRRSGWAADDYIDYHEAVVRKGNAHTAHNALHLSKVRTECRLRFGISILPERAA